MPSVDQLKTILGKADLAHGYVLIGEDVEKIKTALMGFLKEGENAKGESSPLIDAEFFMSDASGSLGIDMARRLKEFLFQMPIKGSNRTAVVMGGDELTPQAQNALLKISEDPPPRARIFLIMRSVENLLSTLASRFEKIYIASSTTSKDAKDNLFAGAIKLVEQFLKGDAKVRSEVIKHVIGKGDDAREDMTQIFLNALIFELGKNPTKHASFLAAVLERQTLLAQYSLNKRLHLELLSSLWYNSQR